MNEKKPNNIRSRDDHHLRQLVSETRAWMEREGIEDQELDWEAIARAERARWWRERVHQVLHDLVARSQEMAAPIATRLRQLATIAEAQATAALEVTLDAVHQVGRVLADPAQACLRPEAGFQFTHAPAGVRTKLGLSEEQEESVGIFISSTMPEARVLADVHQRTVTLECWEPLPPLWCC